MQRVSVETHAERVAALLAPALDTGSETVPLSEALGRMTVGGVVSPVDLPLFRNSQMDGFAVRAADVTDAPVTLTVAGENAAGPVAPSRLEPGTAVRIMTGALVPDGADAVVPVEDTASDAASVTVQRSRRAGEYVRDRGSDVTAGQRLLPAGVRLAARHLAALAAAGMTRVEARRRVRVAVITTGSELVEPGTEPRLGQVFDANGIALVSAVTTAGAVVAFRRHVTDDVAAMTAALAEATACSDVVLTSGGISMGDHEVVRETLEPLGALVGTVAMQPGGPQATAVVDGVPVISFPGNPVSTQLSFEVFVGPHLRDAAGLPHPDRRPRALAVVVSSVPGKRQYLRGRVLPDDRVEPVAGPGSHLVVALASSDVLIVVPTDTTALAEGDLVETWAL